MTMTSQYAPIPYHMMREMEEYVRTGRVYSDFLKAVIDNDLKAAVAHGDDYNRSILKLYVMWFYNHAPALCWGSPLNRTAWEEMKR